MEVTINPNIHCSTALQIWIFKHGFLFLCLWSSIVVQSSGEEIYLTIPALGRSAQLGYMYDAAQDEIIEMSIFKNVTVMDSLFVTRTESPDYSNEFDVVNTFADTIRLLNFDPNTAANILSELTTPKGSSSFLTKNTFTPGENNGILIYKYKSMVENLNLVTENAESLYNQNVISNERATHIVTSITWGANVAVVFEFDKANVDSEKVQPNRESKKYLLIQELENVVKQFSEENSTNELSGLVSAYTDIHPQSNTSLSFNSQRKIHQHLKDMPQEIERTNGGKGVSIQIKLTPINFIRDQLGLQIENKQVFLSIRNWILRDFIEIFDETVSFQLQLNDLQEKFKSQPDCLPLPLTMEMERIQREFKNYVKKFKHDFREALVNVRSGLSSKMVFSNLTQTYYAQEFNLKNMPNHLEKFSKAIERFEYCKSFKSSNPSVKYIASAKILNDAILQATSPVPVYVLFTKMDFIRMKSAENNANFDIFFLKLNKPNNKLIFVDCDFVHEHCDSLNQTMIKELKNGQFTLLDVERELKDFKNLEILTKAAIGRTAQMGELYDARTETFLGTTLLSSKFENSIFTKSKLNTTEIIDIPSANYAEKLKAFDTDSELQLSILGGMVPLTHDAQYFQLGDEYQSFRLIQHAGVSEMNVTEAVHQETFDLHLLHDTAISGSATHFVSHIIYGSSSVFAVKERKKSNVNSFGERAKEVLMYLIQSYVEENYIKNETDIEIWDNLRAKTSNIKVFSNIPQAIESHSAIEIKNFLHLLNYLTQVFHKEQKQPIAYVLVPIENLRDFGIIREIVPYSKLSYGGESAVQFGDTLINIWKASDDIQHLRIQMEENPQCITDTDTKAMNALITEFKNRSLGFKEEFKSKLVQIRARAIQPKELLMLKQEFLNQGYFAEDGTYNDLKKMSQVREKLTLFHIVKGFETIEYVGKETTDVSFNTLFMELNVKFHKIYILYYKPEWTINEESEWLRCTQLFFGPLSIGVSATERKLYLINCEFNHHHCENLTKPTIEEYTNGKMISANYVKSIGAKEDRIENFIQEINSTSERNVKLIESLLKQQNKAEVIAEKNKNLMSVLTAQTEANRKQLEFLASGFRNVSDETTENKNKIQSLATGLHNVSEEAIKNKNNIDMLKNSSFCELDRRVKWTIAQSQDVRNLKCGGLVSVPSSGSMILRFKSSVSPGEEQRCLWTLHSNSNSNIWRQLQISLLCDNLDENDVLSFYEWAYAEPLLFYNLKNSTGQLPLSGYLKHRHYLYFSSRSVLPRTEFIVQLTNMRVRVDSYTQLNWFFDTVPGRVDYDQFKKWRSTSIAVVPQKSRLLQFSVQEVNSRSNSYGNCDPGDSLDIYEVGEEGIPRRLAILCGRITNPILYSTDFPIIAVFFTVSDSVGTFKVSWK